MITKDKFAKDPSAWAGLNKPDLSEDKVDAVIFGIPFDEAVSYRGGAGEGPKVLRENTFTITPYTENFESFADLTVLTQAILTLRMGRIEKNISKK